MRFAEDNEELTDLGSTDNPDNDAPKILNDTCHQNPKKVNASDNLLQAISNWYQPTNNSPTYGFPHLQDTHTMPFEQMRNNKRKILMIMQNNFLLEELPLSRQKFPTCHQTSTDKWDVSQSISPNHKKIII